MEEKKGVHQKKWGFWVHQRNMRFQEGKGPSKDIMFWKVKILILGPSKDMRWWKTDKIWLDPDKRASGNCTIWIRVARGLGVNWLELPPVKPEGPEFKSHCQEKNILLLYLKIGSGEMISWSYMNARPSWVFFCV